MKAHALAPLLLLARTCVAGPNDYNGHQVYRVNVGDDRAAVDSLIEELHLETWANPTKGRNYADVVVPPQASREFAAKTANMETSVMHKNLTESVLENLQFEPYVAGSANSAWFNSYHPYNDHLQFLKDLVNKYPGKARMTYSGTSHQKRRITGIHIHSPKNKPGKKPSIVWHGTVHAREWITTMVVEYLAYSLLTESATNAKVSAFLDKYDFYIFPVVNPDGFVYTQTNDRLWRKNRRPSNTPLGACVGVDVNRNWPYKWNVPGGSSKSPCNEAYRGPSPGSEPETKGLSAFLRKQRDGPGLKMYIDWHSYAQLFMFPYGYTCKAKSPDNALFSRLSKGFTQALAAVYGTKFDYGPICSTIYQVAGDSVDYAYKIGKGKYVFTSELRDTGDHGFVLPKSEIRPSGVEVWAGMKNLLSNIK